MIEILPLDRVAADGRTVHQEIASEHAQGYARAGVRRPAGLHRVEGKLVRGDRRDAAEAIVGGRRKAVAGIVAVADLDPLTGR